jgi:flagellar M-ring protein FliF
MAVDNKSIPVPAMANAPEVARPERKNLMTLVQEWPLSRKIATAAVLLIALVLSVVLVMQARMVDQQLLYANLAMSDAGSVISWLKNQKIEYSLRHDGKDIWVAADKLYQIRLDLAADGLPAGGGIGFEVFDKQSFALSDYVQKVNYTRALQGELARTITSLAPVESTRVHLALPEKRVLKSQQKNPTASVIVTLVPGKSLEKQQVQGIIHLVAGSVADLEPANVKVIDSNGVVLDGQKQGPDESLVSLDTLTFQREVEHRLEIRAQDLLDKTMGKDNAMVRVSATLDFSKVEKTQELFNADDPVVRSEQVNQESSGVDNNTGGVPGVQSNLQGNEFQQGAPSTTPPSSKNSRTTNYEISKTISKVINPIGTINKLSVSVLVADRMKQEDSGTPASTTPRSAEELKSIENMVASAIGLALDRGDMINVISLPFIEPGKPLSAGEQVPANSLYQYLPLVKYGLIGLGIMLLYFLLVRPVIKTMKGEVKEHYKTVEQLEREQQQQKLIEVEPEEPPLPVDEAITALRREVLQNQVPTAFILKNWIQEG